MGDMVKGFLLLVLLIAGSAVAYASWLILVPVTETDAEFRLANVCYGGQFISSALNGADHRPISCDCVQDALVKQMGPAGLAKGADAMRQLLLAQLWNAATGEKPGELDKTIMQDRAVLTFLAATHKLDRTCRISPFSAAAR